MEKKVIKGAIYGKRNVAELIQKNHDDGLPPNKWGFREVIIKKNPSRDLMNEVVSLIPKGIRITYLSIGEKDSMFHGVNILRTAECFGFTTIVLSERESAPINDTVERMSSGAIHHLKIFKVVNLRQVIDFLKENGYWVVATSDRGMDSWDKLPELHETAVIMGNEEAGVKRILLENADFVFQIPMHGKVSSLNVVVATGIVLDRIVNR